MRRDDRGSIYSSMLSRVRGAAEPTFARYISRLYLLLDLTFLSGCGDQYYQWCSGVNSISSIASSAERTNGKMAVAARSFSKFAGGSSRRVPQYPRAAPFSSVPRTFVHSPRQCPRDFFLLAPPRRQPMNGLKIMLTARVYDNISLYKAEYIRGWVAPRRQMRVLSIVHPYAVQLDDLFAQ